MSNLAVVNNPEKKKRGVARASLWRGRKMELKSNKIKIGEAQNHLKMSHRGRAWPQVRWEINKALHQGVRSDEAVAIDAMIEGNNPTDKEIHSIELAMNAYLKDLKSTLFLRYAESVNKFILADRSAIEAVVGSMDRQSKGKN